MNIQNNTDNKTATQNEQQPINQETIIFDILSNIEKHLSSIAYSLDYLVFDDKRTIDKSHSIPD